jgi:sterol desaturase/sphingolipid hydroxylase (fatty acid hydroxylase superfamily)
MEWIAEIGQSWLYTAEWLAGLGIAFAVLARLMPCNPGMYWWKDPRAVVTDFIYWFIVPLFLTMGKTAMLIAGIVVLYGGNEPEFLPVKSWPLWVQCPLMLLLQDVMLYGIHRIFHTRLAWKCHAIHHSPKVLDWMTAMRSHPVNFLLQFTLADVIVLLLGFSPAALVALVGFNTAYSAMVHANLNWTFGPLRYVFASPVFHRWHHTPQNVGLDKNFASTFPVLDLLFGTFYMPPGKLPEQFGIGDPEFPENFLGQLIYPLRSTQAPQTPAAPVATRPAPNRRRRKAA